MSGMLSHQAGLAAEAQVERCYERRGHVPCVRRWRGQGGEIDLIMRDGEGLVFVEVKKARDFARAAARITTRQMQRIRTAAQEYLGRMPLGLETPARIDVALVNGAGQIEIIENAYGQ